MTEYFAVTLGLCMNAFAAKRISETMLAVGATVEVLCDQPQRVPRNVVAFRIVSRKHGGDDLLSLSRAERDRLLLIRALDTICMSFGPSVFGDSSPTQQQQLQQQHQGDDSKATPTTTPQRLFARRLLENALLRNGEDRLSFARRCRTLTLNAMRDLGLRGPPAADGGGAVLFRGSGQRLDKKMKQMSSQDAAAEIAELLVPAEFSEDSSSSYGPRFEASMRFMMIEYVVIVDTDSVTAAGLVLHAPNLPRVENPDPSVPVFRQASAMERRRIENSAAMSRSVLQDESVTGASFNEDFKMPPPAHFRMDCRAVRSEQCNMHPGIAELLCDTACISDTDVVIDCCAGAGTVAMEAVFAASNDSARNYKMPLFFGTGDIERADAAVQQTNFRREHVLEAAQTYGWPASAQRDIAGGISRCQAFAWDATQLPLRAGCVDVIISDLPFGQRCGNKRINEKLYPLLLRECYRVLAAQNGRAVLLTLEDKLMRTTLETMTLPERRARDGGDGDDDAASSPRPCFSLVKDFVINMNGLLPTCFVLKKNS